MFWDGFIFQRHSIILHHSTMADDASPAVVPPVTATASPTPGTTPATSAQATPKPKKAKSKPKRKARRRAGSDSDGGSASEAEGGAARTSDASTRGKLAPAPSKTPTFPDANSTTPAAWADDPVDSLPEVSFDDLSRGNWGPPRGMSIRGRGRGRGGKVSRELTDEERKRLDEKHQAKREKQKAARKEAKLRKAEANAAAAAAPAAASDPAPAAESTTTPAAASTSKPAPAATDDSVDASLAASTSAITLDDPVPPTGPVRYNRVAPSQRTAADPKFTPRVGNFLMHDQRRSEAGKVNEGFFTGPRDTSGLWRIRGAARGVARGAFRGGPRGRGRGGFGFGFGPFAPPHLQQQQQNQQPQHSAPPTPQSVNRARLAETDKPEQQQPTNGQDRRHPRESETTKWGHEGFAEFSASDDARGGRPFRGRGRGAFFRGGLRGGFHHAHALAHLPTPEPSPDRANKVLEGTATQPAAESLLGDGTAVTIRLPGGAGGGIAVEARAPSTSPPSQAAPTNPPSEAAASEASGAAPVSDSPIPPPFTPSNPSPVHALGSDNGSISGGYIPGEFYGAGGGPNANFRPPSGPGFHNRGFPPQSFTPEPSFQPRGSPSFQPRGSFSGPSFYPNGAPAPGPGPGFNPALRPRAGSPLNPYVGGQMGYFMPARPNQKVAIRPPVRGDDKSPSSDVTADSAQLAHGMPVPTGTPDSFVQGYYPPGYNPYAAGDESGVFYPQGGFWPQGGFEQPGVYGYEGEYVGYQ
ncbi:hypothetical protein Q8F55_006721 [Vanrija albida]|uniref:Btz domain-containing protein n=1 Tax=Vanrija albida TaxID=181172 RepID=A0ABR3PY15_9TREE